MNIFNKRIQQDSGAKLAIYFVVLFPKVQCP